MVPHVPQPLGIKGGAQASTTGILGRAGDPLDAQTPSLVHEMKTVSRSALSGRNSTVNPSVCVGACPRGRRVYGLAVSERGASFVRAGGPLPALRLMPSAAKVRKVALFYTTSSNATNTFLVEYLRPSDETKHYVSI